MHASSAPTIQNLVLVVGSTGAGKTRLAHAVARAVLGTPAPIVNCKKKNTDFSCCEHVVITQGDAMQMYRGFDVATNKASAAECECVPFALFAVS